MPHPDFIHKSMSKSKYADSLVENDTRIGRVMDKVRALGLDKNTYVFWTTDNGAWQDVYPDAGYTPFRGTKGTVREGGNRVPAMAWGPKIKAGSRNYDIVGGLDLHGDLCGARRRHAAGQRCCRAKATRDPSRSRTTRSSSGSASSSQGRRQSPAARRASRLVGFDSYDMSPVLFGTGKSARNAWFYFTENELTPGAARVGNYKAVFNLRGDDGQHTGGLAVDTNLGWKGAEKYVAVVPQVFDLYQDPQERYDLFMNNFTERTWTLVTIAESIKTLMKTYVTHPPRKLQSEGYTGPVTLSNYEKFQWIREQLGKEGVNLPMPTGS